jgi:hypothetical protein
MKLLTRKTAPFLAALVLLSAFPQRRAEAWGPSGHRIVALVAMKHLTPQARAQVKAILGDETLADVANWADDVREERPETARWHFVNLPRSASAFSRTRDCADVDGGPGCAVTAIERFAAVLSDASSTPGARADALKFIVHFVGDIHQPLHVSFADNRGGNNIKVKFFNRDSNLHKVWDSGIIGRAGLSDAEFASELEFELRGKTGEEEFGLTGTTTRQRVAQVQAGTIDSWANESFALAKSNAYDSVPENSNPPPRLGQPYYDTNWPVVDFQLIRGGLRLARILNDSLR